MPVRGGPDIVTEALVFYLDANNPKSYQVGGYWRDLMFGNDGSISADISYTNEHMYFDGGQIFIDDIPINIDPSDGNTVEVWFSKTDEASEMLFSWDSSITTNYYNFILDYTSGTDNIGINTGNGDCYGTADNSYFKNQMGHLIFYCPNYFSNTGKLNSKMWINGEPQTMSQLVGSPANGRYCLLPFCISGWNYTDTFRWVGNIDIVKIYNRELTDIEALQNFNATKSRYDIL